MEVGEEIWIFHKKKNGNYKKYKYVVKKSYNTPQTDTSVMKEKEGKRTITLLTCTPIGGNTGRWIIKAEYVHEAGYQPLFTDISFKYKKAMQIALKKISKLENGDRILRKVYDTVTVSLQSKQTHKIERLLRFIRYKVEKELQKA